MEDLMNSEQSRLDLSNSKFVQSKLITKADLIGVVRWGDWKATQ